jgi:hypothetical protein
MGARSRPRVDEPDERRVVDRPPTERVQGPVAVDAESVVGDEAPDDSADGARGDERRELEGW